MSFFTPLKGGKTLKEKEVEDIYFHASLTTIIIMQSSLNYGSLNPIWMENKIGKNIYSYFLFGSNKTLTFFIFGCEVLEIYNTCIQYK